MNYINYQKIDGTAFYYAMETQFHTFVLFKSSFFGLIKKPIARVQHETAVKPLAEFLTNPLFRFKNTGCNAATRKLLKSDLEFIGNDLYNL